MKEEPSQLVYRHLVEAMNDGMNILDEELRYTFVNDCYCEMLGYERDQILGRTIYEFLDEKNRRIVEQQMVKRRRGESSLYELEWTGKDGAKLPTLVSGTPLYDETGKFSGAFSVITDISKLKRAERARSEAEEKYRQLYDNSLDGIFSCRKDGRFVDCNTSYEKMLGYSRQELRMMTYQDIVPETRQNEEAGVTSERIGRQDYSGLHERQYLRKGGTTFPVEEGRFLIRDESGNEIGMWAIARDISKRKLVEQKLQNERNLLRSLIDNIPDVVYYTDRNHRYIISNRAHQKMLGAKSQEGVVGKTAFDFLPKETASKYHMVDNRVLQSGEVFVDVDQLFETPGGERLHVWTVKAPIKDEHGAISGLVGIDRDITEHKRLEEQLLHAQKMEAVGRLAGGVAHDFNNMMLVVLGYSDVLLNRMQEKDPLRDSVEKIRMAATRASSITDQLLAFSRKKVVQPKVLDINVVVRDLQKMVNRLIGEDIRLKFVLEELAGKVKIDPAQIDQVIVNLLLNARDAMPKGGGITIETANVDLDEDYALRHVSVKPGAYVRLSISDTGAGMDRETQSRIFEPFFTTKEPGRGTGLGLSTVYAIVKQAGGNIWVYSEPEKGTTFKIYLPRVAVEQAEERKPPVSPEELQGSETILVVEDEEMVRELARIALEEKGYRVLEAASGSEALEVCRQRSGEIHLVLTDVIMPDLSGREMAEELQRDHRGITVLFMSGYTDNAIVHHGVLDEGVSFIQKPFSPDQLAEKVREVLDKDRHE